MMKRVEKRAAGGGIGGYLINSEAFGFSRCEHFTVLDKQKNYDDIKFIITCLKNHFVFFNLQDS